MSEFLARGLFAPNLDRVRGLLRVRRDAMLAALARELPQLAVERPAGGYFLWGALDGVDTRELLERAEAAGVTFVPGPDFGGPPETLRLAFSFVSPDEIWEGVSRLAAALPAAGERVTPRTARAG